MNETPAAYVRGLSDAAKLVFDARRCLVGGGAGMEGARGALDEIHRQLGAMRSEATNAGVIDTDVLLNETKLALTEAENELKSYKDGYKDMRGVAQRKTVHANRLAVVNVWLTIWAVGATFVAAVVHSNMGGWFR